MAWVEHGQLLALIPVLPLEADVIDARAHHQSERQEPGAAHEQELVYGQVAGEKARRCTLAAHAAQALGSAPAGRPAFEPGV